MRWTSLAVEVQNLFWCMVTATVAGSILVLMLLLVSKVKKLQNSRLQLPWMKCALLCYLLPLSTLVVIGTRTGIAPHGFVWTSDFWLASTMPMKKVYMGLACIWMAELAGGIAFRFFQYRKLHNILKGNIPVENEDCIEMIKMYQKKFHLSHVQFYQNDSILFPISTGSVEPQIILPVQKYSEKELHMILEHEFGHVKHHDLLWKKIGLLVTFIHWWNPFSYILLRKLILQEEIECDIRTCENNRHFTMKEYGYYLAGIPEDENDMVFASALSKSKKDLIRRLEGMARGKMYTKRMAVASCVMLSMLAMIPSYAASESMAQMNERWIEETAIGRELEAINYDVLELHGHVTDEPNVVEIDLTEEGIQPVSALVTLDRTINPMTRVVYRYQNMNAGNKIAVIASCSDSSIVYRIGIRDKAGNFDYIQGSGSLDHVFTIDEAGEYTVYVENRSSSKSMNVTGSATYPN